MQAYRAHMEVVRLKQRTAALATISRFVPVFRARLQLWAARAHTQHKHRAATAIQSCVRMWLARRFRARTTKGVTQLQVQRMKMKMHACMAGWWNGASSHQLLDGKWCPSEGAVARQQLCPQDTNRRGIDTRDRPHAGAAARHHLCPQDTNRTVTDMNL